MRMFDMSAKTIPEFAREAVESWSLDSCLVTLGGDGVFALKGGDDGFYVPGYRIEAVDTVGSGDAFSAGFVYATLNGESFREACSFGNVLGALVATKKGGTEALAEEEIGRLLHAKDSVRTTRQDLARYRA